ncbi:unnamed protein product [Anisakis simplex]|uniref:Uncharacterized protein n=1 Tax=Anisakis simplex TaxID=6269 RepID=A0A0M3KIG0_ANISI|nr:unnamed protein product [Anisakis simplex]
MNSTDNATGCKVNKYTYDSVKCRPRVQFGSYRFVSVSRNFKIPEFKRCNGKHLSYQECATMNPNIELSQSNDDVTVESTLLQAPLTAIEETDDVEVVSFIKSFGRVQFDIRMPKFRRKKHLQL